MKKKLLVSVLVALTSCMLFGCSSNDNKVSVEQKDVEQEDAEQVDYDYGLTYYVFGSNIAYGVSVLEVSNGYVRMECDWGSSTDYTNTHVYEYKLSDNFVLTGKFDFGSPTFVSSEKTILGYWENERKLFNRRQNGEQGIELNPYAVVALIGHYDENGEVLIDDIRYDFKGLGVLAENSEYSYDFDRFKIEDDVIDVD